MSSRPSDKRRTPRCDANGNLAETWKTDSYRRELAQAKLAGVPDLLLDPRGWTGDLNDTTGLFADLIYDLGSLPIIGPEDMSDAEDIIKAMVHVCETVGADYRRAIPWPTFTRFLREGRTRTAKLDSGEGLKPDERNNCFREDGSVIW